jgi:hypothetical protein
MSVTVLWKTLEDGMVHSESFAGFDAAERAARRAFDLTQSSGTYHVRIGPPGDVSREVSGFGAEDCAGVSYPHKDDAGRLVWACCESSIGPVCQHRAEPEDEHANVNADSVGEDLDEEDYGALFDPPESDADEAVWESMEDSDDPADWETQP